MPNNNKGIESLAAASMTVGQNRRFASFCEAAVKWSPLQILPSPHRISFFPESKSRIIQTPPRKYEPKCNFLKVAAYLQGTTVWNCHMKQEQRLSWRLGRLLRRIALDAIHMPGFISGNVALVPHTIWPVRTALWPIIQNTVLFVHLFFPSSSCGNL